MTKYPSPHAPIPADIALTSGNHVLLIGIVLYFINSMNAWECDEEMEVSGSEAGNNLIFHFLLLIWKESWHTFLFLWWIKIILWLEEPK